MTVPQFVTLQRRFLRLVSQERPLDAAAREGLAEDSALLPLASWIDAPDEALALERLNIYAQQYFGRLRDSLRDDYANFAKLVRPRTFDRIAARYITQHPSDNPSLRYHGRHFPEFVRRGLQARGEAFAELRPDVTDLCRLEWSRIERFDAPEATPLSAERLKSLAPEAWGGVRLGLVPAACLLTTEYVVSEVWAALERGAEPPPARPGPERLLVWRRGFAVQHRALDASEAKALERVRAGTTFAGVCEVFAAPAGDLASAGRRALAALLQWIADEILIAVAEPQI